jgi:hypothetical protein
MGIIINYNFTFRAFAISGLTLNADPCLVPEGKET